MYSAVNTIWVLLGAALVFFMQAGFAMCEAGFTRAKNTGNILMKNLMDCNRKISRRIKRPPSQCAGIEMAVGIFIMV